MFTFSKNAPEKPSFSKNTLILDYLARMEKELDQTRLQMGERGSGLTNIKGVGGL